MIRSPHLTALSDQLAAATTDARRQLRDVALRYGQTLTGGPPPAWLAWHIARLADAVTSQTVRSCPHIGATPTVACAAVWDPGHLTCRRCVEFLTPEPSEDSTCDSCRRHADPIYPGAIALGPVLLAFGLCTACKSRDDHASRPGKEDQT